MKVAPPPANLDRWDTLLTVVLETRIHERIPAVAVDGIALVESRTIEYASHEVRIQENAAVSCSCLNDRTQKSCAHRMAVAVRLWQAVMVGLGAHPGDADPYPLAADYRRPFLMTLVERFLEPSRDALRARRQARFQAVRRRLEETGPAERLTVFTESRSTSAAPRTVKRVEL